MSRLLPGERGDPPLDGVTPVFEEVGAAPTAGLDRPPGSLARFGAHYYWKYGTGTTDWSIDPFSGGSGGSPLTTKGDIYGFAAANARVPVGNDYEFLQAYSLAANGVRYAPGVLKADWTSAFRYYFLDYDAGSDSNLGYIDGAASVTFTGGQTAAVALKTIERLRQIVPQNGNGRGIVILQKLRAGGATYLKQDAVTADKIDTSGWYGYTGGMLWRGSTDLTNNASDKITCGFQIAVAGPGGSSEFTVAAGATATVVPIAAGTIAAEGGTQYRMRFLPTTTTVALRNICKVITSCVANTSVTGGNALPATPAAGDVFVIEKPGVVVGTLVYDSTGLFSTTASLTFVGCQLAGIGFATTAISTLRAGGANPFSLSGCEQIGATTNNVFVTVDGGTMFIDDRYFDEAAATQTLGMGFRLNCGVDIGRMTKMDVKCIGTMNLSASVNIRSCNAGQFGVRSYLGGNYAVSGAGYGGINELPAQQNFQFGDPLVANAQPRMVGSGGALPLQIAQQPVNIWRLSFESGYGSATHGCIYLKHIVGGSMTIDGCTGSGGNPQVGVEALQCTGLTLSMGATLANTVTGTLGDIKGGGGGIIAHADLLSVGFTDQQGNVWTGQSPVTSGIAAATTNSSGGALAVGDVVRVSAAGAVSKSFADALSHAKIDGVWLTTTPNGVIGYMAAPTDVPRVNVDALCTPGQQLYLSPTTAGTLTSTRPSGTQQLLRAGRAFTQSASSIRAVMMPETEASVVPVNITVLGGTTVAGATTVAYSAVQTEPWDLAVQLVTNPAASYVGEWANDTGAAGLSVTLKRNNDGTTSVIVKNNAAIDIAWNIRVLGWPGG